MRLLLSALAATAMASSLITGLGGEVLYPVTQTFDTKKEFLASSFWTHFKLKRSYVTAQTTAIFIKRDRALVYISKKTSKNPDKLFGRPQDDIDLVELKLGSDMQLVGSTNYPLYTLSAEFSTGAILLEMEVSSSRKISLGTVLQLTFGLGDAAKSYGSLETGHSLSTSLAESIICRANPGSSVQLQVTNEMMYFPRAMARKVTCQVKNNYLANGPWENVTSTINSQDYEGALFYVGESLSKHRCVTDMELFENATTREFIEYNQSYLP